MSGFEFPKNIKQIGTIEDGLKIYIEDYVCTYLSQYAEGSGYDERLAFLVGRSMVIDGQTVLFISGCIQSMYCVYEKGIVSFSDKSWIFAKEQMRRYFRDLHIVGWMQSQPGYGIHLNSNCAGYHMSNFIQNDHVLFVMDPIEKVDAFYVWNEKYDGLSETKGYFIYYDKNRNMHDYMLDHKLPGKVRIKDTPITKEDLKKSGRGKEQTIFNAKLGAPRGKKTAARRIGAAESGEASGDNNVRSGHAERLEQAGHLKSPERLERLGPPGSSGSLESEEYYSPIIKQRQSVRAAKYTQEQQKRAVNMLVSFSAVLIIICFIMGAGLIRNDSRVTTLERQLTQLNTAYRDLLLQIPDGGAASVFAAGNDPDSGLESAESHTSTLVPTPRPTPVPTAAPTPTPTPFLTPEPTPVLTPEPTPIPTPVTTPAVTITPQPTQPETEGFGVPADEPVAPVPSSEPAQEPTQEPTQEPVQERDEPGPLGYNPADIPDTYLVQQGDNLSFISQKFYGDRSMVDKIMEINGFSDPNMVYYGREIKLPK